MQSRTIKVLPDTDIIEVRYAGEITYEYRLGTLDDIERMLPRTGLHRLLINYTSAWPTREDEPQASAAFGDRLGRVPFASDARIALLNAPSQLNEQTYAVVSPAGFMFRQFHDRLQAIEWLSVASDPVRL